MSYTRQSTFERLFFFLEAITVVSSDPEISGPMAEFGFDEARLDIARDLYARTHAAFDARQNRYSEQLQATDRMYNEQSTFVTLFRNDRNLVRSVLQKKRSEWEAFGLNTRIYTKREKLVNQAEYFYNTVKESPFVLSELESRYKVSADLIDSRLAELQSLIGTIQDQQVRRAEAQVATQRKQASLKEMDRWMQTFLTVAREAFKDDRKQLEKLGLVAKVS